jgi:hypothetical protein
LRLGEEIPVVIVLLRVYAREGLAVIQLMSQNDWDCRAQMEMDRADFLCIELRDCTEIPQLSTG